MSISEYDFNIENYSVSDLERFLKLDGHKYNESDINENESNMRYKIIHSIKTANPNKKETDIIIQKIISFLLEAKRILVDKQNTNKMLNTGNGPFVIDKLSHAADSLTQQSEPIPSYQALFPRGRINQLKKRITTYSLCMNTLFRDYKSSTYLDTIFMLPYTLKNVMALRLVSMEIPETIYLFSDKKKTNRLYIKEDNTNLESLITIPEGNYDSTTLPTVLQALINTTLGSGIRFKVGIDAVNGKTTISNTTNTFTVEFIYGNETNSVLSKNAGWLLGYRKEKYENLDTYTSEGIFSSSPLQYIFFVLNDYAISNTNSVMAVFNNGYIEKNILAKIQIPTENFQVLFDNSTGLISKNREYFGPIDIIKFSVKIIDQYGDIIDINNKNFSFTIELDLAYDI